MNIFVLDENPVTAAQMHCDTHVCKMVIESAQMLCGVFPDGEAPYKRAYYHHPCSKWTRASMANYSWHLLLAEELSKEYTHRYGKIHKCNAAIEWCANHVLELDLPKIGLTSFAQAMPDQYKNDNVVQAYRAYYLGEKARFAKWRHARSAPDWWLQVHPKTPQLQKG